MTDQASVPQTVMDMVQEDHLRLAFLLDQLEDELDAAMPVAARLEQVCREYDRHTAREEQVLAENCPEHLEAHRAGHHRMRNLLAGIADGYRRGDDVRAALDEVKALFTRDLLPEDAVFQGFASAPL